MKEKNWNLPYEEYEHTAQLSSIHKELLIEARRATRSSYVPYSSFRVGVSIRLYSGKILTGSNFENASYPLCLCGERVALAAAHSMHPDETITDMAITATNPKKTIDQPVPPCGACRQVLCEVEQKQKQTIRLILQGETGPIQLFQSASLLLPSFFRSTFIKP